MNTMSSAMSVPSGMRKLPEASVVIGAAFSYFARTKTK
jgi:hypothetical protein